MPKGARFRRAQREIVRAGAADPDHTVRMEIEEILEALERIRGGPEP